MSLSRTAQTRREEDRGTARLFKSLLTVAGGKYPSLPTDRVQVDDINTSLFGYSPIQIGDKGQSVPSAALFRVSKAGQRKVAGDNFEFSVADPPKQIPII